MVLSRHDAKMQHSECIGDLDEWLIQVSVIAHQAGQLISRYYHADQDLAVEQKKDGTPVTEADQAADDFISSALQQLTPHIPLVTEESVAGVPYETRKDWSTYWLVDPMDGTKEFINRSGEFSVNIALVDKHRPILGVVYGPEIGILYAACDTPTGQARKIALDVNEKQMGFAIAQKLNTAEPLKTAGMSPLPSNVQVAVSRRHGGRTDQYMHQIGHCSEINMGSALKACLIAEGTAHIYPRFGPTSLWDTAASQMIVESAGGAMLNAAGHPLQYIQTPTLLNPFFIVVGDAHHSWPQFPEVL